MPVQNPQCCDVSDSGSRHPQAAQGVHRLLAALDEAVFFAPETCCISSSDPRAAAWKATARLVAPVPAQARSEQGTACLPARLPWCLKESVGFVLAEQRRQHLHMQYTGEALGTNIYSTICCRPCSTVEFQNYTQIFAFRLLHDRSPLTHGARKHAPSPSSSTARVCGRGSWPHAITSAPAPGMLRLSKP